METPVSHKTDYQGKKMKKEIRGEASLLSRPGPPYPFHLGARPKRHGSEALGAEGLKARGSAQTSKSASRVHPEPRTAGRRHGFHVEMEGVLLQP